MKLNYIDNMDCLEGMKALPDASVDAIITDPPYGIDFQSQWKKDKTQWMPKIANDKQPFTEFIPLALKKLKPTRALYIFTRWDVQPVFIKAVQEAAGRVKSVIIWDKVVHGMGDLKASYGSRYESILFCPGSDFAFPGKRPQDIITAQRVAPNKLTHPNEKPVELISKLIEQSTQPGAIVLDPFMGSGTTAVACIRTGRNFVGFELDGKHHSTTQRRVSEAVDQLLMEGVAL